MDAEDPEEDSEGGGEDLPLEIEERAVPKSKKKRKNSDDGAEKTSGYQEEKQGTGDPEQAL